MVGGRELSPWDVLAKLEGFVELHLSDLPECAGGGCCRFDGRKVHIYIDRALSSEGRTAALAHELVHVRRGLIPHDWPSWMRDREEAVVRAETARWLVPQSDLRRWAAMYSEVEQIKTHHVMEQWRVPFDVATEAMRLAA